METLIELVRDNHGSWTLVAVFLAAALEYMVPPLPADSVVLAAALLVVAGVYPFWLVAIVAIGGGATGALSHYGLGRLLSKPDGGVKGQKVIERILGPDSMERFLLTFRNWGMWAIVVNRALPGVRAITFFAAGAARLPLGMTMAAGLVSNVAWTMAILGLGVGVGESAEKIEAAFAVYKTVVYSVGGALLLALIVAWWWRKRRR